MFFMSNKIHSCECVTGCYQQAGTEKCFSVPSSENSVDSDDPLHETYVGNIPAVYDSLLDNNDKMRTASSLLYSAAEALDSSVMDELCLYVCDLCTLRFSTGVALRRHRRHHKDGATCTDCGYSFYSATVLRHHLLMQCPRKMVTCNICWEPFDGWPSLSRHTATTHPASHVCPFCGQAFLHVHQLFAHRTVHATNIYRCRTCARRFCSRSRAKRHVTKHITDGDGRIAEGCLKAVSGDGLIPDNQLNRVNKDAAGSWLKGVKGDACLSGFNSNEVVKDSVISNQQKQSTVCVSDSDSRAYSPAHGLLPAPSPVCSLPAAMADSNGHVDGHRIVLCFDKQTPPEGDHTAVTAVGAERVTCAECSRTFKRLSDLHVHMQCHTGEMRYKCTVCGRPFRKSGTLARHMRIHTGERPYICETCGKSYKLLFHLRLHMTVHSSDRPFSCDVCGKAFQSATGLKKHQFVHTGVKPFPCPICLRLFNRCSNMRAHMRVHDGARQHEVFNQEQVCILCRKKFSNAAGFQAHLQTHARQIGLDVGETITAVDSANSFGTEVTYCKVDKQQTEDVYVALPLVHFDDFDDS